MSKKKTHNPKGRYIIHSRHSKLPKEDEEMTYISFDPGEINFTVRIEKRCRDDQSNCCKAITTLSQNKHRVNYTRSLLKNGKATQCVSTSELIDALDSYKEFYPTTSIALIEGQMTINYNMYHMQSVIIAYFLVTQPHITVVEISSKLKGTRLGAPNLSRTRLKKWGIDKALYLAEQRDDQVFISYINRQKKDYIKAKKKDKTAKLKIDDDTDNYIQIEAFCAEARYQLTRTREVKSKYKGPPKLVPVDTPVKRRRVPKKVVESSESECTITESSESEYTITESSE